MYMKRIYLLFLLVGLLATGAHAQNVLTLDSCRALAIANNKSLKMANEKTKAAHYQQKAAFTRYLPSLTATGTYVYNQKEFSLLSDEQKASLGSLGDAVQGGMQSGLQGAVQSNPTLAQNPLFMQLVQALSATDLASPLNAAGAGLADAFRTDTRHVYAGAITLTQPLYMGGKIIAYNKISRYAEALARTQHDSGLQDLILSTDQAYWQVVSLAHKKRLAESFVQLLQKLDADVEKMMQQGMATKADGLSVKVKVNEAEMTLTKVENGLSLARMLLCQLCGLDLEADICLADEATADLGLPATATTADVEQAYRNRPELQSLELATLIYDQKVHVARADYLPSLALTGNYLLSNPSVFNSFEKKFGGMFSVGVLLQIPLCHWGEGFYKTKAAKAEARIARYQAADAREKIALQVRQSAYQAHEAAKKLAMAQKNMEKADENLRYANLGFHEGLIPPSNVLEAHTAWLSAQSDKIDAQIDVRLTEICLQKAVGLIR